MIEQGANVVVCQHSHCPGCYERYLEGFIAYGQGNLLFDTYPDKMPSCWYEGFLVNLSLEQTDRLEFSIIPYIQSRNQTGINEYGNQCSELLHEVEKRSNQIKNIEFVEKSWGEFCDSRRYEYLGYIHGYNKLLSHVNKRLHLTDYLYSKRSHNLMLNTLRCETHREILETVLNGVVCREKGKL
jgi:poly-gamma-glutamate synthesis protein (capsule biosynthesis protein)